MDMDRASMQNEAFLLKGILCSSSVQERDIRHGTMVILQFQSFFHLSLYPYLLYRLSSLVFWQFRHSRLWLRSRTKIIKERKKQRESRAEKCTFMSLLLSLSVVTQEVACWHQAHKPRRIEGQRELCRGEKKGRKNHRALFWKLISWKLWVGGVSKGVGC